MLKSFIFLFIFDFSYGIIMTKSKQKEFFNMKITKDTVIGNILDAAPETAPFFLEMGMHCLGCPASRGETVEMACAVHGVNADELIEKINNFLGE
jgi:hybrid cluster-associated redox disulfide protein